jgi:hypothetical protein
MRARKFIQGATYAPETVKVLCQAFDEAWASIAQRYSGEREIERARLRLANSVLSVAAQNGRDVQALKQSALLHMAGTILLHPSSNQDPEVWRKRAEETRAEAEKETDPDRKKTLLDIAADYDELARLAEERLRPH